MQPQYSKLLNKLYGGSPVKAREERERLEKEFSQLNQRMQEVRSKLPQEYENHGWVWLFLRRPVKARAESE